MTNRPTPDKQEYRRMDRILTDDDLSGYADSIIDASKRTGRTEEDIAAAYGVGPGWPSLRSVIADRIGR